jgi:hypothetical protein
VEKALGLVQPLTGVDWQDALEGALLQLEVNAGSISVGSVNGEWSILALARAGEQTWLESTYLSALQTALSGGANVANTTSKTDKARIILALSALGVDASSFDDSDLIEAMDNLTHGTLNGDVFALIALNSKPYDSEKRGAIVYDDLEETETVSDGYIKTILDAEISGGGWNISGGTSADVDGTAMVLQALAPYYGSSSTVQAAISRGLAWLKTQQTDNGGFTGFDGGDAISTCSTAQVIVALTALGIDPTDGAWTVTGGWNPIEALLTNYDEEDGVFGETDKTKNALMCGGHCGRGNNIRGGRLCKSTHPLCTRFA